MMIMRALRIASRSAVCALAVSPVALAQDREFFETNVRPILAEHCYDCHGAEKHKAGLRLDHGDFIREGSEAGPVLVPDSPAASKLLTAISYADVNLQMPPSGKLSAKAIEDLTTWVNDGAWWPEEALPGATGEEEVFDLAARKAAHWAWKGPEEVAPPESDMEYPLDAFVRARLAEAGIAPAPRASKEVLLRRLSFDLIGLPPTPESRTAFLADDSPGAYEKEVDRLLASPEFGERWARHWMDIVRYSDTYGHEQDFPIDHAWRYRDYLIRALNDNVPYDRLLREHIAGDLVEDPRRNPETGLNESILGTGFWFMYQATHAPVDPPRDRADRIDNQLDVMSKAFLGMTVACARCHEHKFDAISDDDYYALGGFLRSSRRDFAYLTPEGELEAIAAKIYGAYAEAQEAAAQYTKALESNTPEYGEDHVVYEDFDGESHHGWFATGEAFRDYKDTASRWIAGTKAKATPPGVVDSGHVARGFNGVLRSPAFTITHDNIHVLAAGENATLRVIVEDYLLSDYHKLLFENTVHTLHTEGGYRWFSATHSIRKYIGMEAYIEIEDPGDGYAAVDAILFSNNRKPPEMEPTVVPVLDALPEETRALLAKQSEAIAALEETLPKAVRAITMTEGTPQEGVVFVRGDTKTPGDAAPRRFLEAVTGCAPMEIPEGSSGRMALANQIACGDNPLTARVFVNRVWHHLIGKGIVATPDNFGVLGARPSHPELLDYLARNFVEDGWSIKSLIRDIALSETYRMDSAALDANAEEADPDNTLLHRANVRRLEGEAIRDSLLAVSGRLDKKMYGPSVPAYLSPFMTNHRRPGKSGPMDGDARRSVYQEVRRNFLSPMMLAFDMPVPDSTIGRRTVSNVPAQALVMMNNPLVTGEAEHWAKRLIQAHNDPGSRMEAAYVAALGRTPDEGERDQMRAFLARQARAYEVDENDPRVWHDFCHVMFMLKEFIYLR